MSKLKRVPHLTKDERSELEDLRRLKASLGRSVDPAKAGKVSKARDLIADGRSLCDAAKCLNVSRSTLSRWLK